MEKLINNLFQSIEKELINLFKSNEQKLLDLIKNIKEDKVAWNHQTNFEYNDRYAKMKKSALQRNLYLAHHVDDEYQWIYQEKNNTVFSIRYSLEDVISAYKNNNIRWQLPDKSSIL